MNYLPLCLLYVLLPVSGMANAASADNQTNAKPVNSASKTYDAKGKLLQKTDDKGRRYNAKGQYQGKTTTDGKHYDAKGKFTGKTVTTPTGSKSYDARGKLLQKTDQRGRIYDAKGKYQGKVKPLSAGKSEKRDATGKLVEVKKPMTQAVDATALAEQACIESHLPPDAKAAALLVALKSWHIAALQRDHSQLLPDLYPSLQQFSQLNAQQQQQVSSRFAFIYALKARSEQQQLADALCHAVLWQRYEALCHCLKTGDSNVRLDALCWGYQLRRQLPWQLAVPALLNNVCDKIFDVDLSLGLAWWLLIFASKEPLFFMKTFAPEQRLLLKQYDDRIAELMPKVNVHVSELAKIATDLLQLNSNKGE